MVLSLLGLVLLASGARALLDCLHSLPRSNDDWIYY